jgi:uncharacterized membrane protein
MSPRHPFLEFLGTPTAQAVLWLTVLLCLLLVAFYIVKRFRDGADDDRLTTSELLTNFREMNRGGDISDAEFRTIKTVLGDRWQTELKDSTDEG